MSLALEQADRALAMGEPPFGVVILNAKDDVIAATADEVVHRGDMSAHAEILAVRAACQRAGADLRGCVLYTTCEPCPMCYTAAWLARIDTLVYATTMQDVYQILGERQRELRMPVTELNGWSNEPMTLHANVLRSEAIQRFKDYASRCKQ
jgi:tRNA(Arg) A34 adenosine deaminase TadA